MEILVQREKYDGQYQTKCYNCKSILAYQDKDIHRNPAANRVLEYRGFSGYTGEIRCPNCHTWLPHFDRNLKTPDKLVVYTAMEPSVRIPDNIKEIEIGAFRGEPLTEVILPQGLIRIGSFAFAETNLDRITIPESVSTVESNAFINCTSLQEIVFEGAPSIDQNVFLNCPNVKKIVLKDAAFPQFVEIFQGCNSLEEIECPDTLKEYADRVIAKNREWKWKMEGKCAFCGGDIKGGLIKKCSVCGQKKSY